ncbi:MAG: hypothetical protein ACRETX_13325, partial [Steroidobacteraceae bacterium]
EWARAHRLHAPWAPTAGFCTSLAWWRDARALADACWEIENRIPYFPTVGPLGAQLDPGVDAPERDRPPEPGRRAFQRATWHRALATVEHAGLVRAPDVRNLDEHATWLARHLAGQDFGAIANAGKVRRSTVAERQATHAVKTAVVAIAALIEISLEE